MPTGPGLTIRPAQPADESFIRALAPRFAAVGSPPWRDPALMANFHTQGIANTAALATTSLDGHALLIAIDGKERPLGFIHLYGEHSALTGEEQGYVSTLAVAAEAEGQGVGRALLAAGEDWARGQGYRLIALETFGENAHARAFYRRHSYEEETLKLVKVL